MPQEFALDLSVDGGRYLSTKTRILLDAGSISMTSTIDGLSWVDVAT